MIPGAINTTSIGAVLIIGLSITSYMLWTDNARLESQLKLATLGTDNLKAALDKQNTEIENLATRAANAELLAQRAKSDADKQVRRYETLSNDCGDQIHGIVGMLDTFFERR